MDISRDQLDSLVAQPREALNVELKSWIDPAQPAGQAKIVKAALALRNRNGGFLVVGFDDRTATPAQGAPPNARAIFRPDDIQKLVSQYASEPFEVAVEFAGRNGLEHPVIAVPPGVTVPVAIKSDLKDMYGTTLLRVGDIMFRTLRANGTFSSSAAMPRDWKDIVDICFENREADIGRFVRRQLSGVNPEILASLGAALGVVAPEPERSLRKRTFSLLEFGYARYGKVVAERGISAGPEERALTWGTWEVGLVIDPTDAEGVPSREFYSRLIGANPQYTAWPIWGDTRAVPEPFGRATVREGGWESLLISVESAFPLDMLGFARLDPRGLFYELRALDDDELSRARGAHPRTALDPGFAVLKVTESLLVGLRYAKAIRSDQAASLGFAFRWKGLKGRTIASWSGQVAVIPGIYRSSDDEDMSFIAMSSDTAETAIAPFVQKAVKALFAKFDGYAMGLGVIEHLVRMVIERRIT
jgi:hypothetical protein